jgi:23S rRNA pseudouridine1911/1915/1917 synthase
VLVNGNHVKSRYPVSCYETIIIDIPEEERISVEPQNIPLEIIYEDAHIVVVNKPAGMVVHPSAGHYSGTLVNALLYHCTDLSTINGVVRPGIVHRLDKDTSGLIIAAKNDNAHKNLANQFANRTLSKVYCAVVAGVIRQGISRSIESPIGRHEIHRKKMAVRLCGGKEAITEYKIIFSGVDYTFLKVYLKTGRTHQIRVHFSHIGFPIIGDLEYGSKKYNKQFDQYAGRQLLHAYAMRIVHPVTGKEMIFRAKIPEDMRIFLRETR